MRARLGLPTVLIVSALLATVGRAASVERARDIGVPFEGAPGPLNAITDVPGVEVGQVSLVSGPVVAETWDGRLNDIGGFHVRPETAIAAIEAAKSGSVAEGSVGGGTGMECFGFKGGIGTASRKTALAAHSYMVGVLVQCNTGDRKVLRIAAVPVGQALSARWLPCYDPRLSPPDKRPKCAGSASAGTPPADVGSIIIVVGTDAPLVPSQLDRLAKRAAWDSHGSAPTRVTAQAI